MNRPFNKLVLPGHAHVASPEQRLRSSQSKELKTRLMDFLGEVDRAKATDSHVSSLLQQQPTLVALNSYLTSQYGTNLDTLALEREMKADVRALLKPMLFLNLACLLKPEEGGGKRVADGVFLVCPGRVTGTIGPRGLGMEELKEQVAQGLDPLSMDVGDVLKLIEYTVLKQDEMIKEAVDGQVERLRAAGSVHMGLAIQRPSSKNTGLTCALGDNRSLVVGRPILLLLEYPTEGSEDQQQTFLAVLSLVEQVAGLGRLGVLALFPPGVDDGVLECMHDVLVYNHEGVAYFGPTVWLRAYCALSDFPCPRLSPMLEHLTATMAKLSPANYEARGNNLQTPFTARFKASAMCRAVDDVVSAAGQDSALRASPKTSFVARIVAKAKGSEEGVLVSTELKRRRATAISLSEL